MVEAELLQGFSEGPLGFLRTVAVIPQLGRHEEFVAGDPGLRDGPAYAFLIAVDGSGVDVAVADFEGVGDDSFGLVGVDLEDAESQLGDRLAVVESECGNRHGAAFRHVCTGQDGSEADRVRRFGTR